MKRKKPEHLDMVDAEAIIELKESRGWSLVSKRLTRLLSRHTGALINQAPELETARLRGLIEGLKAAAAIPDILIREGRNPKKPRKSDEQEV